MSRFFGWFFALIVTAACARAQGPVAAVDPGRRFQRFEGWGVSLCWTGKVIGSFPESIRNQCADEMFDPVKGLGFNIARYDIGGGEDPALHFLGFRESIAGYEPSPGKWDWTADAGQRWLLQAAKARGADLFEAFSNSPPPWMTVSGSVTGGRDKLANNLAPAHEQDFADYLVEVTDHFRTAWGITFRTLEPLNEPDSNSWTYGNRQEGCRFDPPAQARIVAAVARALERRGSPTKISASDENSIDTAVATFSAFDPVTRGLIAQINTHSYGGWSRVKLASLAASERKTLWMSEYGDADPSGMTLAARLLDDLNGMHPAAWIYWQTFDNPDWALLANAEDGRDVNYQRTRKYWVLMNYTRFIRPGAVFIGIDDEHSVAALDATGHTLTIVSTNRSDAERMVNYDVRRLKPSSARISSWRTSAREDLASLPPGSMKDGRFTGTLPGKSVTTFVVSGLEP